MPVTIIEKTLNKLAELIVQGRHDELETDTLEIKPVPPDGAAWREIHKSVCAFLNTRGGIVILGVREDGSANSRRYVFTGWQPHAEPNLKEIPRQFTLRDGTAIDLGDAFPPPFIRDFLDGQVAVLLVDELSADRKFAFYRGEAYRRILTGDHKIGEGEIEQQEEFQEEAQRARELRFEPGVTPGDLDLDKLNEYITQLNRPVRVETIKPDIASAMPFLERKSFVKDGKVTTLGVLVCGRHPSDYLGFRCQVHGYVDVPQEIARDKQDLADNILPLMEGSLAYILRNIQVGISAERGGIRTPQYPEELLRETVNNALAHRDYAIDRQVVLLIKPGEHLAISNPGTFRKHLIKEQLGDPVPLRRLLPEAKPRNPKLADVLRVFGKWEGRGIGMATLVNLCLANQIDIPYYIFHSEEVTLYLRPGQLLDDRMERLFKAFDRHIESKLLGNPLSESQKLVLSYLIKSEWANAIVRYTILLTADNNHFSEIGVLEQRGLIHKHPASTSIHPVYVADRVLMRTDYLEELRERFGLTFDSLDPLHKEILSVVYRFNNFSKAVVVSAKETSFNLWHSRGESGDIKGFDTFYRRVRRAFNRLEEIGFVKKKENTRGYLLGDANTSRALF